MKNKALILMFVVLQFAQAQRVANVRFEGKTGFLSEDGTWLLEPIYEKARNFSDGLVAVFDGDKWGYVNRYGVVVIPYRYDSAKKFDSGLALVLIDKEWQYIDKNGKKIEMPNTDKKYNFVDGVAIIKRGELYGLINVNGNVVVEPVYQKIIGFENGYSKVKLHNLWGLIDTKGNQVLTAIYDEIGSYSEGVVPVKRRGLWGIVKDGNFIEVNDAVNICNFNEGQNLTCASIKKKKVGFIDRNGNWILEPKFKDANKFSQGFAGVKVDGFWKFINENGELIIDDKFYAVGEFDESGFASVRRKILWGFIDKNGNEVIEPKYIFTPNADYNFYNEAGKFVNGIVRVKSSKGWGFTNSKNELVGGVWFQNAEKFVEIN